MSRWILLLVLIASPAVVFGQETINYASLSGLVTDPAGAAVAGASVGARETDTNLISTTTTDGEGRFRFAYLKVGPYEVKVHQQGFAEVTRSVTLTVGAAFDLPISLALESANETRNGQRRSSRHRDRAHANRRDGHAK